MMTTKQDGVTVEFSGLYAPADVWLSLGAVGAYPYANNGEGIVDWGGGSTGAQARARAYRLIEQARATVSAPEQMPERVIRVAMTLYREEQLARSNDGLASAVASLARALSGGVTLTHRHHAAALEAAIHRIGTALAK